MKVLKGITPKKVLLAFVTLNLLLGVFIAADYGESTDELFERQRAEVALSMYTFQQDAPVTAYENIGNKQFYGTGHSALFLLAENTLGKWLNTPYLAVSHYMYFVTFQIAVIALFYLICQLTASTPAGQWAALSAAVLFGTQPLLFGHAFINAKDIPLLSIFLVTVTVGFRMADRIRPDFPTDMDWLPRIKTALSHAWTELFSPPTKLVKIGLWLTGGLALLAVLLPPVSAGVIRYAYTSGESNFLGRWFIALGEQANSVPVDAYIAKAQVWVRRITLGGIGALALVGLASLLIRMLTKLDGWWFPNTWRQIKALPRKNVLVILLAGAVWGFALSTRVAAFASGGIVGLYLLLRLRGKAIYPGILYLLAAAITYYLTWPYLWVFGIQGFIQSLVEFSAYSWEGIILFEGQIYTETTLPDYYLFKLIPLQFTLPLLVLALGGLVTGIWRVVKKKINTTKIALIFAWFALPLIYTVIRDSVNYNNFRQYLFVMVPLFVFAALALEWIFEKMPSQVMRIGLVILVLLPGLIGLIRLHPYQYIYYNELTGGVDGAFRQYALDYWLTAYKQAAEFIDENIPAGSSILVWGGERRVAPYLTHEYVFGNPVKLEPAEYGDFDYVLIPTEYQLDLQYHLDAETLFAVEVDDVPLVFVKQN